MLENITTKLEKIVEGQIEDIETKPISTLLKYLVIYLIVKTIAKKG